MSQQQGEEAWPRRPPPRLPRHFAWDAARPLFCLNPTTRYVPLPLHRLGSSTAQAGDAGEDKEKGPRADDGQDGSDEVYHVWRSRDNRKGRHAVVLSRDFFDRHLAKVRAGVEAKATKAKAAASTSSLAAPTDSLAAVRHGLFKMAVRAPVWDVSYDVAVLFTVGSVIWVVNGFYAWLPVQVPAGTGLAAFFRNQAAMGAGVTALVGATVFEVGAVLGLLEAVNENRADCFGWALAEAVGGGAAAAGSATPDGREHFSSRLLLRRDETHACRHPHAERRRLLGGARRRWQEEKRGEEKREEDKKPGTSASPRWSWCPSWTELRTHYVYEIGFWANAIQLVGATIFWIASVTGLPPLYDRLTSSSSRGAVDGIYWLPQVVGGLGFVISSLLFVLETQPRWWQPAPALLGWHIGMWNLAGAVGFTLCGAFGFAATTATGSMAYASSLTTFIGSWAFLIGSIIQWYESLDKYPLSIQKSVPRPVDKEETMG